MIEPGESVPEVPVKLIDQAGTSDTTSAAILGQGRVVFFAVPGAFTPTCHVNHLPGFVASAEKLKAKGVDRIVCASVNDHHVMKTWAEATDALGKIAFIADGDGALAEATGLAKQMSGMGTRFRRAAMLIDDGKIRNVFVEDAPGVTATGAPAILMALEALQ